MIVSRVKNQEAVRDAIFDFIHQLKTKEEPEIYLLKYSKFLAERLLVRVESDDCYFIDLLEDITRMESQGG